MTTPSRIPAWDEAIDVVVAGAGGSGLSAAVEARRAGASVLILEKRDEPGGKTAIAMGSFTASETSLQRECGIADSHADHLEDLTRMVAGAGGEIAPESARQIVEESGRAFEWLSALGVRFAGPNPERAHRAPRMHNLVPDGGAIVHALLAECARLGVEVRRATRATDLILDAEGAVAGVVALREGRLRRIRARATVLGAGDYAGDRALLRAVAPDNADGEAFWPFATGDGHLMADRAGADLIGMEKTIRPHIRFASPPHIEPSPDFYRAGARLIDRSGGAVDPAAPGAARRDFFIVLDAAAIAAMATASDDVGPGRDGWLRTGRPFVATAAALGYAYLEDCRSAPWWREAKGAEAAASVIGCDTAAIERLGFGGAPALVLGPLRLVYATTNGGVRVDRSMAVETASGRVIPGLFAAGLNAAWVGFHGGHGYGLAWAVISGRIAGLSAAAWASDQPKP